MSTSVSPDRVKMVQHVRMESTDTRVFVPQDGLEPTVIKARMFYFIFSAKHAKGCYLVNVSSVNKCQELA